MKNFFHSWIKKEVVNNISEYIYKLKSVVQDITGRTQVLNKYVKYFIQSYDEDSKFCWHVKFIETSSRSTAPHTYLSYWGSTVEINILKGRYYATILPVR